jgi:hypothetical protein
MTLFPAAAIAAPPQVQVGDAFPTLSGKTVSAAAV